jgi:hypothetical protein
MREPRAPSLIARRGIGARALTGVLVLVAIVAVGCSTPGGRPASAPAERPSPPPPTPGIVRSSAATGGIRLDLESAAEATVCAPWQLRVVISNERSSPVHWDDYGFQVNISPSFAVGTLHARGPRRPLDLAAGASRVETITINAEESRALLHQGAYRPNVMILGPGIMLKTAPLDVRLR